MISIQGLAKQYTVNGKIIPALQDINLQIPQGEIFGVIGHSGAGKSTLIRCLNLLEKPTSGKVVVDGIDLTDISKQRLQTERRSIGMIFQHFNLLSSATVFDNVAFPLRLSKTPKEEIVRKVTGLLELVGLSDHRFKYPAQLSGGQKQRVGIARALANDPKVLLCDEATSALDPQTTQSILTLLLDINKQLGITIVLITHEMHVIRSICDSVAVLDGGRIVEQGRVADVFLTPQHPTTREFIQQVEDREFARLLQDRSGTPTRQLVSVSFLGSITYEPVLSRVTGAHSVEFSILHGTISRMKDTPYGRLLLEVIGDSSAIAATLQDLASQGLQVEVCV